MYRFENCKGFDTGRHENPSGKLFMESSLVPQYEKYLDEEGKSRPKTVFGKFANWYFKPKKIEESGKIYEKIGIKFFKKYIPNKGNYWNKKFKKKILNSNSEESLKKRVKFTNRCESVHSAGFPFYLGLTVLSASMGRFEIAVGCSVANLLINVYPTMLQRYNRNMALKRLGELDKLKKR